MKKVIVFGLLFISFACDQKPKIEFQYSNQPDLFLCSDADMDLVKEAVYVFEDYIKSNYSFLSKDRPEGYHNYIRLLLDDRSPAREFFNDYLKSFTKYIKEQDELWTEKDGLLKLDYNHPLVTCIINNIQDEQLKNTIDAMITSNTVRPEVIGPLMFRNKHLMVEDRALATYLIFETFYPKLFYMDSPEFIENAEKFKKDDQIKSESIKSIKKGDTIKN